MTASTANPAINRPRTRLQKRAAGGEYAELSLTDSRSSSAKGSRSSTPTSSTPTGVAPGQKFGGEGRLIVDDLDRTPDEMASGSPRFMTARTSCLGGLCTHIHPSPKKGDLEEDLLEDGEDKPHGLRPALVTIDQVPDWQIYPFVHRGYRKNYRIADCLLSAFTLHNETLNVWTHLIPFFIFAYRFAEVASDARYMSGAAWQDTAAFLVFLAAACICFFNSAVFHLFNCCSEAVHDTLFSVDLIGIIVLIAGSFVPGLHYGFYCEPWARRLYLFAISSLSAAAAVIPLSSRFQRPEWKGVRSAVLGGLAVSGVLPCVHWFVEKGPHGVEVEMFLSGVLSMYAFYGLGFTVYLAHIPERFFPGSFDYAFHSHNIWHLLVCAAAFSWHETMGLYMDWRHSHGCDEIPVPHH